MLCSDVTTITKRNGSLFSKENDEKKRNDSVTIGHLELKLGLGSLCWGI